MLRAAALGILVASSARADSSVPASGEVAAKRRTWGEQCRARFERARAEMVKLDPAFSKGRVELRLREEVLPVVEEVLFELVPGRPTLAAWVVSVNDRGPEPDTGWIGAQPRAQYRRDERHAANIIDELPSGADYVAPVRALWRAAIDDCLRMDAPRLPSAASPWGRASVKGAVADCVESK